MREIIKTMIRMTKIPKTRNYLSKSNLESYTSLSALLKRRKLKKVAWTHLQKKLMIFILLICLELWRDRRSQGYGSKLIKAEMPRSRKKQ
jgi:hypothetical protein